MVEKEDVRGIELGEMKTVIRSLLIARGQPLSFEVLTSDYEKLMGKSLNYKQFGYDTPLQFANDLKDTVQVVQASYGFKLRQLPHEDSKHFGQMFSGQKQPFTHQPSSPSALTPCYDLPDQAASPKPFVPDPCQPSDPKQDQPYYQKPDHPSYPNPDQPHVPVTDSSAARPKSSEMPCEPAPEAVTHPEAEVGPRPSYSKELSHHPEFPPQKDPDRAMPGQPQPVRKPSLPNPVGDPWLRPRPPPPPLSYWNMPQTYSYGPHTLHGPPPGYPAPFLHSPWYRPNPYNNPPLNPMWRCGYSPHRAPYWRYLREPLSFEQQVAAYQDLNHNQPLGNQASAFTELAAPLPKGEGSTEKDDAGSLAPDEARHPDASGNSAQYRNLAGYSDDESMATLSPVLQSRDDGIKCIQVAAPTTPSVLEISQTESKAQPQPSDADLTCADSSTSAKPDLGETVRLDMSDFKQKMRSILKKIPNATSDLLEDYEIKFLWNGHFKEHECDPFLRFKPPVLPEEHLVDVIIVETQSPGQFWIQFARNFELVADLMHKMDLHYKEKQEDYILSDEFVEPGLAVAIFFEGNKQWHRARIESLKKDKVKIFYVDYGTVDLVKRSDLRKLDKRFAQDPMYAVKASMHRLQPPAGMKEWPNESCEFLYENYTEIILIASICERDIKDPNCPEVQLLLYREGPQNEIVNEVLIKKKLASYKPADNAPETIVSKQSLEVTVTASNIDVISKLLPLWLTTSKTGSQDINTTIKNVKFCTERDFHIPIDPVEEPCCLRHLAQRFFFASPVRMSELWEAAYLHVEDLLLKHIHAALLPHFEKTGWSSSLDLPKSCLAGRADAPEEEMKPEAQSGREGPATEKVLDVGDKPTSALAEQPEENELVTLQYPAKTIRYTKSKIGQKPLHLIILEGAVWICLAEMYVIANVNTDEEISRAKQRIADAGLAPILMEVTSDQPELKSAMYHLGLGKDMSALGDIASLYIDRIPVCLVRLADAGRVFLALDPDRDYDRTVATLIEASRKLMNTYISPSNASDVRPSSSAVSSRPTDKTCGDRVVQRPSRHEEVRSNQPSTMNAEKSIENKSESLKSLRLDVLPGGDFRRIDSTAILKSKSPNVSEQPKAKVVVKLEYPNKSISYTKAKIGSKPLTVIIYEGEFFVCLVELYVMADVYTEKEVLRADERIAAAKLNMNVMEVTVDFPELRAALNALGLGASLWGVADFAPDFLNMRLPMCLVNLEDAGKILNAIEPKVDYEAPVAVIKERMQLLRDRSR